MAHDMRGDGSTLNPLARWIAGGPGLFRAHSHEAVIRLARTAYAHAGDGMAMTAEEFERHLRSAGYIPRSEPDRDETPIPPYRWSYVLAFPQPAA